MSRTVTEQGLRETAEAEGGELRLQTRSGGDFIRKISRGIRLGRVLGVAALAAATFSSTLVSRPARAVDLSPRATKAVDGKPPQYQEVRGKPSAMTPKRTMRADLALFAKLEPGLKGLISPERFSVGTVTGHSLAIDGTCDHNPSSSKAGGSSTRKEYAAVDVTPKQTVGVTCPTGNNRYGREEVLRRRNNHKAEAIGRLLTHSLTWIAIRAATSAGVGNPDGTPNSAGTYGVPERVSVHIGENPAANTDFVTYDALEPGLTRSIITIPGSDTTPTRVLGVIEMSDSDPRSSKQSFLQFPLTQTVPTNPTVG